MIPEPVKRLINKYQNRTFKKENSKEKNLKNLRELVLKTTRRNPLIISGSGG
jgi:hypothetical protein